MPKPARVVDSLQYVDLWPTCDHAGSGHRDHRCPTCHHVLRRCCDSLTGPYLHADDCGRRRSTEISEAAAEEAGA